MKDELSQEEIRGIRYVLSLTERFKLESTQNILFTTLAENGSIDETTSMEHISAFDEWNPNIGYSIGNIRKYHEKLYKCLQAHTSANGWEPDVSVSLWKAIGDPTEEYPEWSQPIGSMDAYDNGDKVSHNNKHWKSTVDSNVWEPGVYGWTEV